MGKSTGARDHYKRYTHEFYERLLPLMREGDLQLIFGRNGASLFWQTDGGRGYELVLGPPPAGRKRIKDIDIQRTAQFLRDGDLKKPTTADGTGPIDVAGIIRAAISAVSAFETPEVWYRGQPSVEMSLQPSVFRRPELAREESSGFVRFLIGARSRYENCPADDDFASWLALMQHY